MATGNDHTFGRTGGLAAETAPLLRSPVSIVARAVVLSFSCVERTRQCRALAELDDRPLRGIGLNPAVHRNAKARRLFRDGPFGRSSR